MNFIVEKELPNFIEGSKHLLDAIERARRYIQEKLLFDPDTDKMCNNMKELKELVLKGEYGEAKDFATQILLKYGNEMDATVKALFESGVISIREEQAMEHLFIRPKTKEAALFLKVMERIGRFENVNPLNRDMNEVYNLVAIKGENKKAEKKVEKLIDNTLNTGAPGFVPDLQEVLLAIRSIDKKNSVGIQSSLKEESLTSDPKIKI